MALGKVSSGDFRNGTPVQIPHQYGNPVAKPEPFGNVIPQSNPTLDSNPVTWLPSPKHFGNTVEFSLQSVPPIIIIEQGDSGAVNINLTKLLNSPTATLTFTGAPAGVIISFAPNPDSSCRLSMSPMPSAGQVSLSRVRMMSLLAAAGAAWTQSWFMTVR